MDETLYCCRIVDLSGNSGLVDEFLSVTGYDYASFRDTETGKESHILYFSDKKSAETAADKIKSPSLIWQDMGLKFSEPELLQIKKEEWAEVWKKYFDIQHVSEHVVIKPTWLDYIPSDENEIIVELDPGMSFGTGRHATTRFCIKMLDKLSAEFAPDVPLIDAGCGSGILTVTAYKLGFRNLTAFDNDPGCILCTRENLELNNVPHNAVTLKEIPLSSADNNNSKYDIVIANIMAHILIENRTILKSMIKPDGYLILAGILTEEYPALRKEFESLNLREVYSLTEDEWTGGMFKN